MVPDRRCDRTPTGRFFARLCTAFEDCALQTTLFHFVKRANGQGNQCSQGSCAASLPAIAGRPRQHFTVSAVCKCKQRCLSSRMARWQQHSSPANPSPGRSAVGLRAGRGEAPRHLKRSSAARLESLMVCEVYVTAVWLVPLWWARGVAFEKPQSLRRHRFPNLRACRPVSGCSVALAPELTLSRANRSRPTYEVELTPGTSPPSR